MEDGFVDGHGMRYNPSIIRVGVGQSNAVKDVALESEVNSLIAEGSDIAKVESAIAGYKMELQRVHKDIGRFRHRIHSIIKAAPYPLSHSWEIRIYEETFEQTGQIYFVNHNEKRTTFEVPPPPEPGEPQFPATSMPEYRTYIAGIVKLVEKYNTLTTKLERYTLVLNFANTIASGGHSSQAAAVVRMNLETHILDSVHIVMTTLGTAGNRALESAAKFEVVVVDEAAQSVEPATLSALQLGSSHSILVGDPQQLPATIFSLSGRTTKYDRSLFQRLEEAGHEVHLLNTQYRMHPDISDFPRRIFYDGNLLDGPNVKHPDYGNPLRRILTQRVPALSPFTVLDLDSSEERGGTSLANSGEARLAVHLYQSLLTESGGLSGQSKVAVITPYSQQASLLHRMFSKSLGPHYANRVEINTVDAFQGREANIVIFSCVRAAGSNGIGFLSDVRRMNVALTRAKHFLFVIARCQSIVVNPYWRDLVAHARETGAVVPVHMPMKKDTNFSDIKRWRALRSPSHIPPALPKRKRPDMDRKPIVSILKKQKVDDVEYESGEEVAKPLTVLEKTNNKVGANGVESSDEDYEEMF
uniref:WW domain-containing protein n=1 Tax=Attheya septentrionalis TaxID=420275 RepID=A0A7S2XKG2_9STRA